MINRIERDVEAGSKANKIDFGFDKVGLPASVKPISSSAKAKLVEFLGELTKAIKDGKLTTNGAIGAAARSIEQITIESSGNKQKAIDGIEYGREVWSDDQFFSVARIVAGQNRIICDFELELATVKEAYEDLVAE